MKLTIKIMAVLILVTLASPVFILNGCGKPINGGQCGSCPDSIAPYGSTIQAPSLGTPSIDGGCFPGITFVVLGPDSKPMSEICVEIFTDGASAVAKQSPGCSDALINPKSSLVTRTNSYGAVKLDYVTPATSAGQTFFVQAASCSITAIAETPAAE